MLEGVRNEMRVTDNYHNASLITENPVISLYIVPKYTILSHIDAFLCILREKGENYLNFLRLLQPRD